MAVGGLNSCLENPKTPKILIFEFLERILEIPKAGHSGTLDPQVTGVLPLGLGEGTKALGVLLFGPKEYHALGRLHSLPSKVELEND